MRNIYLILMIVTTIWLGFLGFLDDYIKIFRHNKEGLPGKFKIVGQLSIGLIVGLILWSSPDAKINENLTIERQANKEMVIKHRTEATKSLKTTIPFVKSHNLDYANLMSFCGKYKTAAGWILFVVMTIIVVTAVQFLKAIASFLGPILAAFASSYGEDWKGVFWVYALTTLLAMVWVGWSIPSKEPEEERGTSFASIWSLCQQKEILLLLIGIVCIVGIDVGLNTSIPKLLMDRLAMPLEEAGLGSSLYFAAR